MSNNIMNEVESDEYVEPVTEELFCELPKKLTLYRYHLSLLNTFVFRSYVVCNRFVTNQPLNIAGTLGLFGVFSSMLSMFFNVIIMCMDHSYYFILLVLHPPFSAFPVSPVFLSLRILHLYQTPQECSSL